MICRRSSYVHAVSTAQCRITKPLKVIPLRNLMLQDGGSNYLRKPGIFLNTALNIHDSRSRS